MAYTYKKRTKPYVLQVMTSLKYRSNLTNEDDYYYLNQVSGFGGERVFDELTEKLTGDCLILNDLLLKWGHTTFQIDALLIACDRINVYEIKNFSGEYLYKEELFQSIHSGDDFQSLIAQVNRGTILLKKLLRNLGCNLPVTSYVAFVNPEFVLYQAPLFETIILPNSLPRHFKKLDRKLDALNPQLYQLAQRLCELSTNEKPIHNNLPSYTYETLKKGLSCLHCGALIGSVPLRKKTCHCSKCGNTESLNKIVLYTIREFRMLFPDFKGTTGDLYDWCDGDVSLYRIRMLLKNEVENNSKSEFSEGNHVLNSQTMSKSESRS